MTQEQFWQSYNVVDHDPVLGACWEFNGCVAVSKKTGDKRGRLYYNGKMWQAHVLAYVLTYGTPDKPNVLHHCDTTICMRPEHLWSGTMQDNTDDMKRKGRSKRCGISKHGTANGYAKFTMDQIDAIRAADIAGQSQRSIAREYKTSQAAIWYLIHKHKGEGYVTYHNN